MTDYTEVPQEVKLARSKKQMMYFAIASMVMMFAGLTSGYLVSRPRKDWVEIELPQEFYYSTGIIILSSIALWLAKRSIKAGNNKGAVILTVTTFVLGSVFVYMQFAGFETLYNLKHYFTGRGSSVSASFIYIIVFAHLVHIVAGLISLMVITFNAIKGKYNSQNYLGFELGAIFWHFVDILWVLLLVFFLLA